MLQSMVMLMAIVIRMISELIDNFTWKRVQLHLVAPDYFMRQMYH